MMNKLQILDPEEDPESCIRALKYDNLTAEEFEATWRACWKYRHGFIRSSKTTAEIINKWPFYKTPSGCRLVGSRYFLFAVALIE